MGLDDILRRASSSDFGKYDPRHVIDAVNALLPLGKNRALAALEEFLAKEDLKADPHQGLFLVLRVLFEADSHPPMRIGGSALAPPASTTSLPRFPVVIVDDVPLMLVPGYSLRGAPEPVAAHLDYYRRKGALRTAPLSAASGVNRMARFATLWQNAYGKASSRAEKEFVKAQLDRLHLSASRCSALER